jgi:hypothetical protein
VLAKVRGHRFTALDRPVPRPVIDEQENETVLERGTVDTKGKFF